jgi:methyl-accepting chemotaxis protein
MTIRKNISIASAVWIALMTVSGVVALVKLNQIDRAVYSVATETLPGIGSAVRLDSLVHQQSAMMLRHILSNTPEGMSQAESSIAEAQAKFQTELKAYDITITNTRNRGLFQRIAPAQEQFERVWGRIQPLSRAIKPKEALALWLAEGLPAALTASKACEDAIEYNRADGAASAALASATGAATRFWLILLKVCTALFVASFAFYIVRSISRTLLQVARELGNGAEQVSTAAGQFASSAQSLAQGASEQAASLEETSSSSEELASMTRKNAENSQQAADFMYAMSQRVAEANRSLGEMMTSMRDIGTSSGKISKIIKVIDEIAFQTNILALNAAVEAARAGEAGMGFAVVADEVRNLAQRSAQAAKDTASLIEDSIAKSGEGSKRLSEVVASIQAITEGAGKVKKLVDEADASSREQALGIEQISKSIAQMDQLTQRTASNAEESAAASEALNDQSQTLLGVVERLQSIVGAASLRRTAAHAGKFPDRRPTQPGRNNRPRAPVPALARNAGEFPLDDSEFKDF